MALLRWTCSPVIPETSRLVGTRRCGVDLGIGVEVVAARSQGHHDFFQRTVAGSFANSVDRAFDLTRAVFDGSQAVRHGQPQIVVAMDADHGPVDVGHAVDQCRDRLSHVGRRGIAHGVGNVDRGRPRLDRRLHHPAEKIQLGSSGIFR